MPDKKPGWREKYATEIEQGQREQRERIARIEEEHRAYEERVKNFRRSKNLRNGFKLNEPAHIERMIPEKDDPEW